MSATTVGIVGCGLAGTLMACCLGQRGYRVRMVEHRPDPRTAGFIGGRSINLALSTRGITALRTVGADDAIIADAVAMRGRTMHASGGELTYQPYSKDPNEAIQSVSRGGLNISLLDHASRYETVEMTFERRCVDIDFDSPAIIVEDGAGTRSTIDCDVIIGADGAGSAVRGCMNRLEGFTEYLEPLEHGYKELCIPAASGGGFALEKHALHIWPRGGWMMIALPNQDGSFTCTCFWPMDGPNGFSSISTEAQVREHFERHLPDAPPLMPTLVEDYLQNPTSPLGTVRCSPWNHEGKVLLIGDAAHAIVPFFGQGINCGFEDCRLLCEVLDRRGGDFEATFDEFARDRKTDTDAIADLAIENFIEMRDKVGSRVFLARKKGEKLLHRLLPFWYRPLYNLVSFSNVPYSEALALANRQKLIVRLVGLGVPVVLLLLITLLMRIA